MKCIHALSLGNVSLLSFPYEMHACSLLKRIPAIRNVFAPLSNAISCEVLNKYLVSFVASACPVPLGCLADHDVMHNIIAS